MEKEEWFERQWDVITEMYLGACRYGLFTSHTINFSFWHTLLQTETERNRLYRRQPIQYPINIIAIRSSYPARIYIYINFFYISRLFNFFFHARFSSRETISKPKNICFAEWTESHCSGKSKVWEILYTYV